MAHTATSLRWAALTRATGCRALLLGLAFLGLGLVANQFVFPPVAGAVLWLPSGLSLAVVLRSPSRSWPPLLAAIFVAEVCSALAHGIGTPLWVVAIWGVGNVLRTLLGAWLMRRFVGTSIQLTRRWEIAGLLLFGGLLSPLPSATLGAGAAALGLDAPSFLVDWAHWYLSDGLGTVLVAPLLLAWPLDAQSPDAHLPHRSHRPRHLVEMGVTLALTALVTDFVFGYSGPNGVLATLPYAGFPLAVWAALRLGPLGAASTTAVMAAIALWHTRAERGPFGTLASPHEQVLTVQAFLAVLGMTALTLAAVACERRRTERLQRLLSEAGAELASSLDIRATFPRVAQLVVPHVCSGFALWLLGEKGLLERAAQAGWSPEREAHLSGILPPLPSTSRRWCTPESTVLLVPVRACGSVQGALVLMNDEHMRCTGTGDLMLAEDLARRFGMALENARLFTEAREAVEARNEFIAIAAHELRTPLTALALRMHLLTQLLHQESSFPEVLEKVRAASRQLRRLAQLIEALLDVGRITTGRMELLREPVDVTALVTQVVDSFAEEAARSGSTLRLEAEEGLTAWWDRSRIEQALVNLLTNALKFGAQQPIEVQVSRQGLGARIIVRDQGIGIPPEALERIFGRFERAVSSRQYGGLGLGLFLTQQIIEAHGGLIRVESQPGAGATFVMELPLGPLLPTSAQGPHPNPHA